MGLSERKNALAELGKRLQNLTENQFSNLALQAVNENNWFTEANVRMAIEAWAFALSAPKIEEWTKELKDHSNTPQSIGLIMAGNIPMVGMHDLLAVLVSGHKVAAKLSSQDRSLMQFVINELTEISSVLGSRITLVEQLKDVDAVIATGSDNTARYFKQYFGNRPHIIRQNRTSIGVINGNESPKELSTIGQDIFSYYGLGCRNLSKVYVPQGYDLTQFIDALMGYEAAIEHHKFRNNYDYNKSIYLVNNEPHLDSGFFLMRESNDLVSPISVIFYERYDSEAQLALRLSAQREKIQCIISQNSWYEGSLNFGEAQSPDLWDYADGVNTLDFLSSL